MKGIERNKHTHILKCLEELRLQLTDTEEIKHVEADLETLREAYERYQSFIKEIEQQATHYDTLYKDIQVNTYRALRRIRYKQKNSLKG